MTTFSRVRSILILEIPERPYRRLMKRADLLVFHQQLGKVLLVGVPMAQPIRHDAGSKPGGPYFLTHKSFPSKWSRERRGRRRLYTSFHVRKRQVDVRIAALNRVRRPSGPRLDALHNRTAIDTRFHDHQVVDVPRSPVLGVAQGTFQHLLEKDGQSCSARTAKAPWPHPPAAPNQSRERPQFPRRHVSKPMCFVSIATSITKSLPGRTYLIVPGVGFEPTTSRL